MQTQKLLNNNPTFLKKIYKTKSNKNEDVFENNLINKIKKAEEQIKNGEVVSADIVFKELRQKYDY